jgi:hypothetical protein
MTTTILARLALLVMLVPLQVTAAGAAWSQGHAMSESRMKITIRIADRLLLNATLDDSSAARDFASLLPLTLALKDYASTEKISDLPRRLVTDGAPEGIEPTVGDIAYFAPWGNLAIYYKDFGYSRGLVRLGRIESGIEALSRPGGMGVTIERAR